MAQLPQIAVMGASGYAGGELVRLLLAHPRLQQGRPLLFGRQSGPVPLTETHPQLKAMAGADDLSSLPFSWESLAERGVDLLLLATPHEQSRSLVPEALERGMRVIDLSGAWRLGELRNREVYDFEDEDTDRAAEVQEQSVYGLPELHRACIARAKMVANPGCYATSAILALKPLLAAGWADLECGIVCDAKSGVSGAGKTPSEKTHFMYAADNLSAYAVFGHRHTGELLEQLDVDDSQIVFTPHLLPIPRGILTTIYVRFHEERTPDQVERCYRSFFAQSPMVRLFGQELPQIQYVVRTSFCDLGFQLAPDGRRCVVVSCLDNLLKGAAGQAVQNLNLMCGWKEEEGLA